jgi:hypothetical protein
MSGDNNPELPLLRISCFVLEGGSGGLVDIYGPLERVWGAGVCVDEGFFPFSKGTRKVLVNCGGRGDERYACDYWRASCRC